jgi:hypothetical protein
MFPRITVPVRDFSADHEVSYLLLWHAQVNQRFHANLPASEVKAIGAYRIYLFQMGDGSGMA